LGRIYEHERMTLHTAVEYQLRRDLHRIAN